MNQHDDDGGDDDDKRKVMMCALCYSTMCCESLHILEKKNKHILKRDRNTHTEAFHCSLVNGRTQ